MGIVLELQHDIIDNKMDLTSLLRKGKLIAHKLHQKDFEDWVDKEINGYTEPTDKAPSYRKVHCQVCGHWIRGWIPVAFPEDLRKEFEVVFMCDAIPSLLSVIGTKGHITYSLSGEIQAYFMKETGINADYRQIVPESAVIGVVETVKTQLLEWVLLLEANGIVGENLTFSEKEIEIANKNHVIYNYYYNMMNITGNVDKSPIQQGTSESSQKQ